MNTRAGRRAFVRVIVAWLCLSAAPLAAQDASELALAIKLVEDGDFAPAERLLSALVRGWEGDVRRLKESARAYLYLGISQLELDQLQSAKRSFKDAQKRDKTLSLPPTEFSAQVIRVFDEARKISDEELSSTPEPVSESTPPPTPSPEPVRAAAAAGDWVIDEGEALILRFVETGSTSRCEGSLRVDKNRKSIAWAPAGEAPRECLPRFETPFSSVRSINPAPDGGIVIQFQGGSPARALFIPLPDAAAEGAARSLRERLASASVNSRFAVRELSDTVGLSASSSALFVTVYGLPLDVSLADLLDAPGEYDGRAVRTRGRFSVVSRDRDQYVLTAGDVSILAAPEITSRAAALIRSQANELKDRELEITGVFRRTLKRRTFKSSPEFSIVFWEFVSPGARPRNEGPGRELTLEQLSTSLPPPREPVRVVGKFRGSNLFGDLPLKSRRKGTEWVIKDDIYSAWISGKAPEGDGWKLDTSSQRDTVNWIEVTGRAEERNGFIYIDASAVALSAPPSPNSSVKNTRPAVMARFAPDINFTRPIQGVDEAALDEVFSIQFTKPMDAASFVDRVQLRYVDDPPNVRAFPRLRIAYSDDRYVLSIDPGAVLQPDRELECVLLPGVKDVDGATLNAPPEAQARGALRVLRWRVER